MKTVHESPSSFRNQISTEFAAKRVPRSSVAEPRICSRSSESRAASAIDARISLRRASTRSRSLNAFSSLAERRRCRSRRRSRRIARSGPSSRSRTTSNDSRGIRRTSGSVISMPGGTTTRHGGGAFATSRSGGRVCLKPRPNAAGRVTHTTGHCWKKRGSETSFSSVRSTRSPEPASVRATQAIASGSPTSRTVLRTPSRSGRDTASATGSTRAFSPPPRPAVHFRGAARRAAACDDRSVPAGLVLAAALLSGAAPAAAADRPVLFSYDVVESTRTLTPAGERNAGTAGTVRVAGPRARWELPHGSFPRSSASVAISDGPLVTLLDPKERLAASATAEDFTALFRGRPATEGSAAASLRDVSVRLAPGGKGRVFEGRPSSKFVLEAKWTLVLQTTGRVARVTTEIKGTIETVDEPAARSGFDGLA